MRKIDAFGLTAALALLLAGCAHPENPPAGDVPALHAGVAAASGEARAAHARHDAEAMGVGAPVAGMSIYQLESPWTDQHGARRQLADLRGHRQVIAMVYTNCGSACPLIVGDMKRLEAEFADLGFVLVSIDPERDTPGRLHEFAAGSQMGDRWTLLNGTDDQLLELATVLGVRYRRVSDSDFMHSNVITVLDEKGQVIYRQEGLGEAEEIAEFLRGKG